MIADDEQTGGRSEETFAQGSAKEPKREREVLVSAVLGYDENEWAGGRGAE